MEVWNSTILTSCCTHRPIVTASCSSCLGRKHDQLHFTNIHQHYHYHHLITIIIGASKSPTLTGVFPFGHLSPSYCGRISFPSCRCQVFGMENELLRKVIENWKSFLFARKGILGNDKFFFIHECFIYPNYVNSIIRWKMSQLIDKN